MAGRSFLAYTGKERAETVTFTEAAAGTSSACNQGIFVARLLANRDCFIDFGKPVSTATTTLTVELLKGQVEYFALSAGHTIEVLGQTTGSGRLNIMWGTK